MPLSTATNATFDALLAAVPAPYGPLARAAGVDLDVAPFVVPNSNILYETVSTPGVTVWISFDQLSVATVSHDIMRESHGTNTLLKDLFDLAAAVTAMSANIDPLLATVDQYQGFFRLFGSMPALLALFITTEWYEQVSPALLDSDFSMSIVSLEITFTSLGSEGVVANHLWDFGDGNTSVEWNPVHTYAGAGTYDIVHTVVSTAGVHYTETSQAVA